MKAFTLITLAAATLLSSLLALAPSASALQNGGAPQVECGDFSHTSQVVSGSIRYYSPNLNQNNLQDELARARNELAATLLAILQLRGEPMPNCKIEDCPRPENVGCVPEARLRQGAADTKYSLGRTIRPDGTHTWYIDMELKANRSVNLFCNSCVAPIGDQPLD